MYVSFVYIHNLYIYSVIYIYTVIYIYVLSNHCVSSFSAWTSDVSVVTLCVRQASGKRRADWDPPWMVLWPPSLPVVPDGACNTLTRRSRRSPWFWWTRTQLVTQDADPDRVTAGVSRCVGSAVWLTSTATCRKCQMMPSGGCSLKSNAKRSYFVHLIASYFGLSSHITIYIMDTQSIMCHQSDS